MIRGYWFLYGPIIIAIIYQIILTIPYSTVDDFVKFYNNYTEEVLGALILSWFLVSISSFSEVDTDDFTKKSLTNKILIVTNLMVIIGFIIILIYKIILAIHNFFDKHLTIKLKKDDN